MSKISFHRGDTQKMNFVRKDFDGNVILTRPDAMYFTVKEKTPQVPFLFQKTLKDFEMDSDGTWHFTIEPKDTDDLEFDKQYLFDLEIIADGVKTTVDYGSFKLLPEVTYAANEGA